MKSTLRNALKRLHAGQEPRPGTLAYATLREAESRDKAALKTSCGICGKVIDESTAGEGRDAFQRHRRQHGRTSRRT